MGDDCEQFDFKSSHGKKINRENNKIPPKWMKETKIINDKYSDLRYELREQYDNGEIGDDEFEIKMNDLEAEEKNELKDLYKNIKNKQDRMIFIDKNNRKNKLF